MNEAEKAAGGGRGGGERGERVEEAGVGTGSRTRDYTDYHRFGRAVTVARGRMRLTSARLRCPSLITRFAVASLRGSFAWVRSGPRRLPHAAGKHDGDGSC